MGGHDNDDCDDNDDDHYDDDDDDDHRCGMYSILDQLSCVRQCFDLLVTLNTIKIMMKMVRFH